MAGRQQSGIYRRVRNYEFTCKLRVIQILMPVSEKSMTLLKMLVSILVSSEVQAQILYHIIYYS